MNSRHAPVYYPTYLQLDRLLSSQQPLSEVHDEMLFIIVHQAFELWFKLILHDLDSVLGMLSGEYVDESSIGLAVARLQRIVEIQRVIIEHFTVLETMTPLDFLEFRDYLVPASGSQSVQFRLIENKMGLLHDRRVRFYDGDYWRNLSDADRKRAEASEHEPSLFDVIDRWLSRTPFLNFGDFQFWRSYRDAVDAMLENDRQIILSSPSLEEGGHERQLAGLERTRQSFALVFDPEAHARFVAAGQWRFSFDATLAALLILLYRDRPILQQPFRLLTTLIQIDELFTAWRHRHSLMVQRMIGAKIGTGGSSGHDYLAQTAKAHTVFTDLFNMSTYLIPRSLLPVLPEDVERALRFVHEEPGK
ncbi:MAG TPA: tryptophan 2,3-dioxygenase family protein [Nitrolancea sp.]|nr:tryptophan 2,3-dioxygenase family protein [Nitrolancea sp.]